MQRQRSDAGAALGAQESNDFPPDLRPRSLLLLCFHARKGLEHAFMLNGLQQVFGATCSHGRDNSLWLRRRRNRKYGNIRMFRPYPLRNPSSFFCVAVVVDHANASVASAQCAIDLALRADIMI